MMNPTTFLGSLALALVCGACASTSTPKPLTSLPSPDPATQAATFQAPPVAGDIQFTEAQPKAKAKAAPGGATLDESLSTSLEADKASVVGVKTQHVHAAQ
jgi:hypothetical protein